MGNLRNGAPGAPQRGLQENVCLPCRSLACSDQKCQQGHVSGGGSRTQEPPSAWCSGPVTKRPHLQDGVGTDVAGTGQGECGPPACGDRPRAASPAGWRSPAWPAPLRLPPRGAPQGWAWISHTGPRTVASGPPSHPPADVALHWRARSPEGTLLEGTSPIGCFPVPFTCRFFHLTGLWQLFKASL